MKRQTRKIEKNRKVNNKYRGILFSKKLVGLFIVVILALVGLAIRITYINANHGEQYSKIVLSQAQQQYESQTIPFKRGDILDRNGTILATSEKVYSVILDCKVVNNTTQSETGHDVQKYLEPTIKALVEVLELDESDIRNRLTDPDTKDSQYQVLAEGLSITQKKAFEAYVSPDEEESKKLSDEEKKERKNVKGVWFEAKYNRVYPLNSLACDLIGFTYDGETADWGIEGYYSSILNGTNGRKFGYFDTEGLDVEQTIIEPEDGHTVVSTIDANIQQIVRDALEEYEESMKNGPNGAKGAANAAVIVMDPNNGEVLAMDSSDWYDLNDPRNLSPFYTEQEIATMDTQVQLEKLNEIWRNYCISDAFEPGSTVKPLTVATALEKNRTQPADTFYCDGFGVVAGQTIKCVAYPEEHGEMDLAGSLIFSCNDVIMQLAEKIGKEDFLKYQKIFNFGERTGIDLPGENTGILHTEESMGEAELATSAFGQGYTCTMIQEAAAFASAINGGTYYKPHVVSEILDTKGSVVTTYTGTAERQTISEKTSQILRTDLQMVVDGGTGMNAKVAGYSMGGKTGTAEKLPRSAGKYLVSFIGYAPADNPQVLVYVVVDEPNAAEQGNSDYAMGVWRSVMEDLLPYLNIFQDEEVAEPAPAADTTEVAEGEEDYEEEETTEPEMAVDDNELTDPPEQEEDETVENGGNDIDSEGIANDEWSDE